MRADAAESQIAAFPGKYNPAMNMTESQRRELDSLLAPRERWDTFYADRARPCPFFVDSPDENLVQWTGEGLLQPGRAADFGCGHGRNAVFLARQGFSVDAFDYSPTAIDWARERAARAGVTVSLSQANVFDLDLGTPQYDLIYDSGCFHHIPPHRRDQYVDLVVGALKPGGWFGMTCFRPEGGSGYTDDEVYEHRSMGGGLGYTEAQLRQTWSRGLHIQCLRQMKTQDKASGLFGESFLWVLLARKVASNSDPR